MKQRIIIVGASSGIGYEVAKIYLRQGFLVGLAARRLDRLEVIRNEFPDQVHVARLDVTLEDAPKQLETLVDAVGGMDVYLHCSGIGHQNMELKEEIEQATIQTNAVGFTRMVLAAFRYFERKGGGQVAVISSIAGTKGLGAAPSYSATKRFQINYVDALAQLAHMKQLPIFFTDIRPGFVRTDILNDGKHYPLLLSAQYAAKCIVKAITRKKRRAIIDWKYAWVVAFWKLIPAWLWERLPIRN